MYSYDNQNVLKKIFRYLIPISVLMAANTYAQTATFEWDPPPCPLDGYELYVRMENESYDYSRPIYKGKDTSYTIDIEKDSLTRYFVVRAYRGAEFSENSNEVSLSDVNDGSLTGHWPNNNKNVELAPVLILSYENDTLPHTILWQISTERKMSPVVLSIATDNGSLSLKVPEMVLDTDTKYYWQAKFYDVDGNLITASDVVPFTTMERSLSEDKDSDGIPDHQRIGKESDLDGDGVPDSTQSDLLCINAAKGNAGICVKSLSSGAFPVAIKSFDDTDYSGTLNKPKDMIYGLIGFKLFLDDGVESADVGVFFSKPAPVDSAWYKLDPDGKWTVFEEAAFAADRKAVTFSLTDGDSGDEDGIKNGIIVDPSGLGSIETETSPTGTSETQSSTSSGSANCYINSLTAQNKTERTAACSLFILFIVIFFGRSAGLWMGGRPKS